MTSSNKKVTKKETRLKRIIYFRAVGLKGELRTISRVFSFSLLLRLEARNSDWTSEKWPMTFSMEMSFFRFSFRLMDDSFFPPSVFS